MTRQNWGMNFGAPALTVTAQWPQWPQWPVKLKPFRCGKGRRQEADKTAKIKTLN